jgi:thiol-disulfide isomerase/thioredoxin
VVSDNINKRLTTAMDELKDKHASGTNEVDDDDRAPTGDTYKAQYAQMARQRRDQQAQVEQQRAEEASRIQQLKEETKRIFINEKENETAAASDDDDSDYDDLLDEDPELEAIRDKRIHQMREAQIKHAENMARGHGQYRTVSQDEFLPECAGGSEFVAAHFFHKEFERCKIMDHHLKLIAPLHATCKFIRVDAEKAPFFVSKLVIKTLPSLIVFQDGKVVDRLTGFDGLAKDPKDPDRWHTGRLQQWLSTTGAIEYTVPNEEIQEEMRRLGITPKGTVWSGMNGGVDDDEYDSDFE